MSFSGQVDFYTGVLGPDMVVLSEKMAADGLPPAYQVLYHLVDLFEGQWGTMADVVLEGHLLFAMAGVFGIKVPRNMDVDTALRSVDSTVRRALQEYLTSLEQDGLVTVQRGNDPGQSWKLAPMGLGYNLIYKWRGHRMDYSEHIAAQPRGLKRIRKELFSAPTMSQIITNVLSGVLGALALLLLTHII